MKQKAKCKRGHLLKPPNLIYRNTGGKQRRECRECANDGFRNRRAENKKKRQKRMAACNILDNGQETIMSETEKAAESAAPISPMDFLEPAQSVAAEQLDAAQGAIELGDPESPHALDTDNGYALTAGTQSAVGEPLVTRIVHRVADDGTKTEIAFEDIKKGDRFTLLDPGPNPIEDGSIVHVAIADADAMDPQGNVGVLIRDPDREFPGTEMRAFPSAADLDAHAEETAIADATGDSSTSNDVGKVEAQPVPAAVPKPSPRRVGCEHGFANVALCPQCRAARR